MNAKRKTYPWYQKVISRINFNTIIMAIIAGAFSIRSEQMDTKTDTAIDKIDSSTIKQAEWKRKRDIKDSIINVKQDSIIAGQNKIIKLLKNK